MNNEISAVFYIQDILLISPPHRETSDDPILFQYLLIVLP